jgi:hypothetical protein
MTMTGVKRVVVNPKNPHSVPKLVIDPIVQLHC